MVHTRFCIWKENVEDYIVNKSTFLDILHYLRNKIFILTRQITPVFHAAVADVGAGGNKLVAPYICKGLKCV